MSEVPVLGYWNIRGLAERIRIMMEHCNVKFEDKLFTGMDWFDVKPTMGMDFPNLPYYIDGDFKLTESMAIMKYIARKHGMAPDTAEGWGKVEMVEGALSDYNMSFVRMCYSPDHEALKVEFLKNSPTSLAKFDSHLGKNTWLGGEKLTYIDFCVGETLDHIRLFYKDQGTADCFADFKNVKNFLEKYDNLESVAAHRKADGYRALPCNGAMAKWGGKAQ